MATVNKHLEGASGYKEISKNEKMNMTTVFTEEDGIGCTIMKCTADGLTIDEMKDWYHPDNMMTNINKVESIITGKRMEDHEGYPLIYQHVKTPIMVTNRVTVYTLYNWEEDGSLLSLSSSLGNEKYVQDHPELVGKNVECNLKFGYSKITPRPEGDGVDVTEMMCIDLCGDLPDFVKSMISWRFGRLSKVA